MIWFIKIYESEIDEKWKKKLKKMLNEIWITSASRHQLLRNE